jgi:hypothetical protein
MVIYRNVENFQLVEIFVYLTFNKSFEIQQ